MISLSALLGVLLWLAIAGVIFWLIWWLIGYAGLPQPFDKVARVIVAIAAVIVLINFLLMLAGVTPLIKFPG